MSFNQDYLSVKFCFIFRDVEMNFLNVNIGLPMEFVVNFLLKWYLFVENPVEVVGTEQVDFSILLNALLSLHTYYL